MMKAVNRTSGNDRVEVGINSLPVINVNVKKQKRSYSSQGLSKLPSVYVPSIHVPASARPKVQLTDFLQDLSGAFHGEQSAEAYFKVNILARDKAIQILQQYNEIVADDNSLAVKNLPPVKVSIRPGGSKTNRNEKAKKIPVFTEGISSISKRPDPSFSIPKDGVIRSNLPKSVVVAQEKNKFTFGVRTKDSKKPRDSNENTPRYRQLRMLGLDNLPAVDTDRYMTKEQMMQASVQYRSRVKGGNMKTLRRKSLRKGRKTPTHQLDKLNDSQNGQLTNRSQTSTSTDYHDTSRSENKIGIISIGDSLGPKHYESTKRNVKNNYPLYDWKLQQQEELRKLTFQSGRKPSMYGVCSLAPIRVGGQLNKFRTLEPVISRPERSNRSLKGTRKVSKKKFRSPTQSDLGPWYNEMLNYTQEFQHSHEDALHYGSDIGDFLYDDTMDTYQKEVLYHKPVTSPAESNSTGTTHTHMPNPPPSYVSSTDDEIARQTEIPRAMLQIQEERTGFDLDTKDNPVDTCPDPDPEIVSVTRSNSVARKVNLDGRRSKRSMLKEAKFGSIVNLEITGPGSESGRTSYNEDGFHLSVPHVHIGERRPPARDDRSELSESFSRMHMDSQATWHSARSEMNEPQKLKVTTLTLFDNENETINPTNRPFITPMISVTPDDANDENTQPEQNGGNQNPNQLRITRELTEEEFKKLTLNNKTIQFISPLQVLDNAKRQ